MGHNILAGIISDRFFSFKGTNTNSGKCKCNSGCSFAVYSVPGKRSIELSLMSCSYCAQNSFDLPIDADMFDLPEICNTGTPDDTIFLVAVPDFCRRPWLKERDLPSKYGENHDHHYVFSYTNLPTFTQYDVFYVDNNTDTVSMVPKDAQYITKAKIASMLKLSKPLAPYRSLTPHITKAFCHDSNCNCGRKRKPLREHSVCSSQIQIKIGDTTIHFCYTCYYKFISTEEKMRQILTEASNGTIISLTSIDA